MAFTSSTSLLIGFLIASEALWHPSAHAYHQDRKMIRNAVGAEKSSVLSRAPKRKVYDAAASTTPGNRGFGARKMMVDGAMSEESQKGLVTSEISVSRKQNGNMFEDPNAPDPGACHHRRCLSTRQRLVGHKPHESRGVPKGAAASDEELPAAESQRLPKAAREIVNLLHKDYKGAERPRRKPPINN